MGVTVGSSIYNAPSIYESGAGGGGGGSGTTNIGGRDYRTVKIGGSTWLAENLDYKFSGCGIGGAGTPINPNAWYYNNDETTYGIDGTLKCGLLYNWFAVKFLNDNKSALIPGWHVPTKDEFIELANEVGGVNISGTILKAYDLSWAPSWNGIDLYGFGVLPAGYYDGNFYNVQVTSAFWSITEKGGDSYKAGFDNSSEMHTITGSRYFGNSVRLVKD